MPNAYAFKSDTSFLEKISMGAIGTQRVFENLCEQGHRPIELERGSMSYKIWKSIKIKRIRVPDILCINCNRRVESRAKTQLQISMSHSHSDPERSWDHGLEDGDLVALVLCRKAGGSPIAWVADRLVQYVSVEKLRAAQHSGLVVDVRPKGAEEGFEARLTWPASVASASGSIVAVTDERLQYRPASGSGRVVTLQLNKDRKVTDAPCNPGGPCCRRPGARSRNTGSTGFPLRRWHCRKHIHCAAFQFIVERAVWSGESAGALRFTNSDACIGT